MKKCWKIALAVAAVAGVIPYSHKKDEESGASVLQALLWSYVKKPDGNIHVNIGLHVGSIPLPKADHEASEPCDGADTADFIEELPAEFEETPVETVEFPADTEEAPYEVL